MDEFVSTFTNRLDPRAGCRFRRPFARCWRGRVRGALLLSDARSERGRCGRQPLRGAIGASLAQFEPFSEDHEFLSTTLIGESEILKIDQDGRVVLTEAIKAHAGIADRVTFVGQGYKFQIWEPERFIAYREEAKNRLRESGSGSVPATARRA